MKILFCAVEVAPYAKVGGLADVAGSLPKALADLGHDVRVVMPAYGYVVANEKYGIKKQRSEMLVRVNSYRLARVDLFQTVKEGVIHWFIDSAETFAKATKSEEVYAFGRDDYLMFTQAALEACTEEGWIPDVVSAHDWHAGFFPVALRETKGPEWNGVASTYTIHNLAYQGEFGYDSLAAAGVSEKLFNYQQLETYGSVNFLKAGCVFADQVNTVSPNYAREITTPEFGCRLEGLMQHLTETNRLRGILNGIDVHEHNPETDPQIAFPFSVNDISGKSKTRAVLLKELGMELDDDEPLFSVISRLSNQKGFDLMVEAVPTILTTGGGWVVLGTGDPWAAEQLRKLEARFPGKVKFVEAFDAPLAQRIYAGSDIFIMPSSFEPCGLGQMFAMRYGTVPVVRHTGGLADTVFEGINGFVCHERSANDLMSALLRAKSAFQDKARWSTIRQNAMNGDYSWDRSAHEYIEMFEQAISARKVPARPGRRG